MAVGGSRTRTDSFRQLQSRFLVRGADDAARPMRGPEVSVGGKVLREYSYADGAVAATPQV